MRNSLALTPQNFFSSTLNTNWPAPVVGLAGFSGSGKTTLLCQLIHHLNQQGIRVAVVKHSHHQIELDKPGKDSFKLRESGAQQTLLASPNQITLFLPQPDSDDLSAQLRLLDWSNIDCVFVEGYRHAKLAKLEVHRPSLGKPLLCLEDKNIFAVATETELPNCPRPTWPLNDSKIIAKRLIKAMFPS